MIDSYNFKKQTEYNLKAKFSKINLTRIIPSMKAKYLKCQWTKIKRKIPNQGNRKNLK